MSNRSAVVRSLTPMATETFQELFDEYGQALFRFVCKLTRGDRELAEDIVQETLLRAWQRPHIVSTEHESVRPWLYTVARNLVCDYHRARAVRPNERTDIELSEVPDPTDFVAELLDTDQIARAIARLSSEHRDVLVEVYYQDRSLADAAARLGIPVGTVKSRLHYAQQAIRFVLGRPDASTASWRRRAIAKLPAAG